jgi:hypothetical protein
VSFLSGIKPVGPKHQSARRLDPHLVRSHRTARHLAGALLLSLAWAKRHRWPPPLYLFPGPRAAPKTAGAPAKTIIETPASHRRTLECRWGSRHPATLSSHRTHRLLPLLTVPCHLCAMSTTLRLLFPHRSAAHRTTPHCHRRAAGVTSPSLCQHLSYRLAPPSPWEHVTSVGQGPALSLRMGRLARRPVALARPACVASVGHIAACLCANGSHPHCASGPPPRFGPMAFEVFSVFWIISIPCNLQKIVQVWIEVRKFWNKFLCVSSWSILRSKNMKRIYLALGMSINS